MMYPVAKRGRADKQQSDAPPRTLDRSVHQNKSANASKV